ncbi:MAG: rod shape-determining protein MreC [Bacteroidales bacterium]|jgi:rod shape-determining protein MreC|nr:rod shape-determining protein MreC [Bacteroidales bacterium]MDD3160306.1 rod shape-determining protein MreC [Bacteroidales bacterium]
MDNLINFIVKHGAWILFILLQTLCIVLIYNDNPYQRSVLLSSGNQMTGSIYKTANLVTGYFYLRSENKEILQKNIELEHEVFRLREALNKQVSSSIAYDTTVTAPYQTIFGEVIDNSVSKTHNYILINKGSKDGIKKEMGVINQNGIVGIVSMVSESYSIAISLLNAKLHISCKVKGDGSIGSLTWQGGDPSFALLEELPRHTRFSPGDTIITSGFSAIFPEGIMVGTIDKPSTNKQDLNTLIIKLSTDFYRLKNVCVIGNEHINEIRELEKEAKKND